MLGFSIIAYTGDAGTDNQKILARWKTGIGGLGWIEGLVREKKAKILQANGYPNRYQTTLADVLHAIQVDSITPKVGIWVVGDDYALTPGYITKPELINENIESESPNSSITVDAWDLS